MSEEILGRKTFQDMVRNWHLKVFYVIPGLPHPSFKELAEQGYDLIYLAGNTKKWKQTLEL